jgi:hypothetical protein
MVIPFTGVESLRCCFAARTFETCGPGAISGKAQGNLARFWTDSPSKGPPITLDVGSVTKKSQFPPLTQIATESFLVGPNPMKHPYSRSQTHASAIVVVAAATLMAVSPVRSAFYEQARTAGSAAPVEKSSKSWLAEWWDGKYASGNWFGVRDTLEDRGLTLGGRWIGVYYGVVDGGIPNIRGSYFDEEIKFTGNSTSPADRLGTPRVEAFGDPAGATV